MRHLSLFSAGCRVMILMGLAFVGSCGGDDPSQSLPSPDAGNDSSEGGQKSGGNLGSGATGGNSASGGSPNAGGSPGLAGAGGSPGTGGASDTGGSPGTGGGPGTGGTSDTGGSPGTGGSPPMESNCWDVADNDGDDLADCADPDCAAKICRPAAGDCDLAEICAGGVCPADAKKPADTVCRNAAGGCDSVAEKCTGSSTVCPLDVSACAAGQYCSGSVCVAKKGDGQMCTGAAQCASGNCVDGYCCNMACSGRCQACNIQGKLGTCSPHGLGSDPEDECGNYFCNGLSACFSACTGTCSPSCKSSAHCSAGQCKADLARGLTCSNACQCSSGHCIDGRCCSGPCSGPCEACSGTGLCTVRPAGYAPAGDACGNYACDGTGKCKTSCTGDLCSSDCKRSAWCGYKINGVGTCEPDRPGGGSCFGDEGCKCSSNACCGLTCCY